jgi:hypothetical protein
VSALQATKSVQEMRKEEKRFGDVFTFEHRICVVGQRFLRARHGLKGDE